MFKLQSKNTALIISLFFIALIFAISIPRYVYADEIDNLFGWFNLSEAKQNNNSRPIHNINKGTYYDTLNLAFDAADEDDTISIESDYTCEEQLYLNKSLTIRDKNGLSLIKGDGTFNYSFGNLDYGADYVTFDGVTFDMGSAQNYIGFHHQYGKLLTFNNCKFNGQWYTYGNTKFVNCNFTNSYNLNYNIDCYGGDINFENCDFTSGIGKFILIYRDSYIRPCSIYVKKCNFTNKGDVAYKSAVVVKLRCLKPEDFALIYDVRIDENCELFGNFPENERLGSKLVMVDNGNSYDVKVQTFDSDDNLTMLYPVDKNQYLENIEVYDELQLTSAIFHKNVIMEDGTYSCVWESNDPSVCTIDKEGNMKKIASGYCRITIIDRACLNEQGNPMMQYFNVNFPHFILDTNGHGEGSIPEKCWANPYEEQIIPTPVAEGYTFEGWYEDQECKIAFDVTKPYEKNEDKNLYAKWKSDTNITKIILNQDEATKQGTKEIYAIYAQGYYSDFECTNLITSIPQLPEREGYEFQGYWTKEDLSDELTQQIVDKNGTLETQCTWFEASDATIYCKWSKTPGPGPDPDPPVPDPDPAPEIIDLNSIATGDNWILVATFIGALLFGATIQILKRKNNRWRRK